MQSERREQYSVMIHTFILFKYPSIIPKCVHLQHSNVSYEVNCKYMLRFLLSNSYVLRGTVLTCGTTPYSVRNLLVTELHTYLR